MTVYASVFHCLACGSRDIAHSKGVTAPFIARRVWNKPPFAVGLLTCDACGFAFFEPRMTDSENAKLYADYRSDSYVAQRNQFEPWYTESFNESLGSESAMRNRRKLLAGLVSRHIAAPIRSVLDYGGHRGSLVRAAFEGAECFVYDVDSVEPLPGVTKVRRVEDGRERAFNLIVCSNVLEHASDPADLIREIVSIGKAETLIFLEVPLESPFTGFSLMKRLVQQGLMLLKRPELGLELLRFNFFVQMHEHVNFFTEKALTSAAKRVGCNVLCSGVYEVSKSAIAGFNVGAVNMVWLLASIRPEPA